MESKKSHPASWILFVIAGFLLIFTAYRTVELLSSTLPDNQWWIGIFALAALDGGLIGWTVYLIYKAESDAQVGIAWLMIFVSFAGIVLSLAGDTLYQGALKGVVSKNSIAIWAIVVQVIVIAMTIIMAVICHIIDPDVKLKRKERRLEYERKQAEQRLQHDREMALIQAKARHNEILAQEGAEQEAAAWLDHQRGQSQIRVQQYYTALPVSGKPDKRDALPRLAAQRRRNETGNNRPETDEAPGLNDIPEVDTGRLRLNSETAKANVVLYRICKKCGGPISPDKRADSEYCTDSCRKSYSRTHSKV